MDYFRGLIKGELMEFKEINVPEGIVQQIDYEGPFAGITVDMGNGDNIYSNINLDVL